MYMHALCHVHTGTYMSICKSVGLPGQTKRVYDTYSFVQRHHYRVGSHLKFQTVQNETFQSVPEVSGTYGSSFDVKPICSMTSEDFSDVYKYSGLQALFVTVFQTSVDLLCKKSYKSSSMLGYFECFQSNHTAGCCNIKFGCLSQIRREKFALPAMSLYFCCTFL